MDQAWSRQKNSTCCPFTHEVHFILLWPALLVIINWDSDDLCGLLLSGDALNVSLWDQPVQFYLFGGLRNWREVVACYNFMTNDVWQTVRQLHRPQITSFRT